MGRTVLIVDDHPGFRVTARALLETEGFDVVGEAEDGESALRIARDLQPDIVLVDVPSDRVQAVVVAYESGRVEPGEG